MSPNEQLQRIRARCVELLAIAEKRTPGSYELDACCVYASSQLREDGMAHFGQLPILEGCPKDIAFVASCAGPAEAAWRSTIAAIDWALLIIEFFEAPPESPLHQRELEVALDLAKAIIAAWEGQI